MYTVRVHLSSGPKYSIYYQCVSVHCLMMDIKNMLKIIIKDTNALGQEKVDMVLDMSPLIIEKKMLKGFVFLNETDSFRY